MNDRQAILRLKWGDIRALDALVERYQVRAIRTAYLITHDAALASDVVQDAFLSAYRAIGGFDLRRPFAPWFMRSVVNGAIKASRRDQSHDSLDDFVEDNATFPEPLIDTALEEVVASAQTEQAIWDALAQLAPERRAVIVLRYYLDLSEIEMAEQLDIPAGTVKSRLHAAKRQLRDLLQARVREE